MDSDDIMVPNRLKIQIEYMITNPTVMICGGQVNCFNNQSNSISITSHKSLSLDEYIKKPSHWFLNHPTVCYRKKAILEAGNYNKDLEYNFEDLELLIRILKKYNKVHSIGKPLILYRSHEMQITKIGGEQLYNDCLKYTNKILSSL